VIGNHHLNGTTFKAWQPGGALRHFSMQMGAATGADAHAAALDGLRNAAGRYQVIYSESTTTPPDAAGMRRHAWAAAMAGVMPMLLQMNIADTPVEALQECRHLQRFFEATDFFTMSPQDDLKHAGTSYVLADPGRSYIAYGHGAARELGVSNLPAGKCSVTWLDCITGKSISEEHQFSAPGARSFRKPAPIGDECAVWIRYPEVRPTRETITRPAAGAIASTPRAPNQPPQMADQNVATAAGTAVNVQLGFTDDDGPGPYSYTIVGGPQHGTLTGDNNDRTYTPAAGFSGEDQFTWRAKDGLADSRIVTVRLRVDPGVTAGPRPTGYFPVPES
jgi:hypothetical protein